MQTEKRQTVYSRQNPFPAEVLENINLNGPGSNKETRHLELTLEDSGLSYEPGDTIAIYPENDPELVDMILEETNWDPEEQVTVKAGREEETYPLKKALLTQLDITDVTKAILKKLGRLVESEKIDELLGSENKAELKEYMVGRDLLDLIREYNLQDVPVQDVVSILRKKGPRLYSIASSLAAVPGEVHLTIGAVRYKANGRERKGVCSVYCAERVKPGDKVSLYVQPNKHFFLPEDRETPIIMVGPGTGVAPFRSFMQELEVKQAGGKAWMFFGEQHYETDFLYKNEWNQWLNDGVLTKLDLAFSRDIGQKVYVQHRMLENSKELFEWLENGAYFYVCGDKNKMAKDVHNALLEIIEKEGGISAEQAEEYLNNMKKEKRYQRDVY
ncbi:sulfite reductase (NADPH) flavoprotein alpha-component [Alteribacillus bidgolensis]|uniref:assimilatory sulfite reductase (NADPH) n=1 Tax=Alteribacillus bidgolensis TaxID=930129 RepID=A0A1G8EEA7_9BACI|nr:sulfite reductase (NADPH) flavoprotein alpha-component [Alteribacillus bidgolensis]